MRFRYSFGFCLIVHIGCIVYPVLSAGATGRNLLIELQTPCEYRHVIHNTRLELSQCPTVPFIMHHEDPTALNAVQVFSLRHYKNVQPIHSLPFENRRLRPLTKEMHVCMLQKENLKSPEARSQTLHAQNVPSSTSRTGILDAPSPKELENAHWHNKVGRGTGIWVSVKTQTLFVMHDGKTLWHTSCSTAAKGVGTLINSNKTPPGWHRIKEKIGDHEPWGRIFRGRVATGETWKPGEVRKEDLVLSRILWLEGLEPGINKGKNAKGQVVDSHRRFIYIHGTNDENRLGKPASHGCIRLSNDAVISLFNMIPQGTCIYIAP